MAQNKPVTRNRRIPAARDHEWLVSASEFGFRVCYLSSLGMTKILTRIYLSLNNL
jgi:hypothetical protein